MNNLCKTGFGILLLCQTAVSSISTWTLNNHTYQPSDTFSVQIQTTFDTVKVLVFLETGSATSGLNSEDKILHAIRLIDNNTEQKMIEQQETGKDIDPAEGVIKFSPGKIGLAPGLYHISISEPDTTLIDTFRVIAPSNPYRTISGMVSTAESLSLKNILVKIDGRDIGYSPSAWTDSSGKYTIGIDQETFNKISGKAIVGLELLYSSYVATPSQQIIDCSQESKSDVNFKIIKASSVIKGTVQTVDKVLKDIRVGLYTTDYSFITSTLTDSIGSYSLYCAPGVYLVRISMDQNSQYLQPQETKIDLSSIQSVVADFKLLKIDSNIYGRITVKDQAPSTTLYVNAFNQNVGGNRVSTNNEGFFRIPVSSQADSYWVAIERNETSQILQTMIVENGNTSVKVKTGDTVNFNFIDKPSGGISGTITNETGFAFKKFFIMVHDTSNSGKSYNFEWTQSGNYTFHGIPSGTYYAEGGILVMKDMQEMKLWKKYSDSTGKNIPITVGTSVIPDINWVFASKDTNTNISSGNGILQLTLIDSTGAIIEKAGIMLFDQYPSRTDSVKPIMYYGVQTVSSQMRFNGIPQKQLYVAIELIGKSGDKFVRFVSFASDSGKPKLVDFQSTDTQKVKIAVFAKDSVNSDTKPPVPTGNGYVKGKITYSGKYDSKKLLALLYDIDAEKVLYAVTASDSGFYAFEKLAAGKYQIAAAIDTNGDKNPESVTLHDTIITITNAEVYTGINITLVDRKSGTGGISGTLTYGETLPSSYKVVLSALSVDTLLPDSSVIKDINFLLSYQTTIDKLGTFSIGGLPDGVYYLVVHILNDNDSARDNRELGFGVFGDKLTSSNGGFPFDPKPIIISNGQITSNITVAIISKDEIIKTPVIQAKAETPMIYSLQTSTLNPSTGILTLKFAVPENTTLGFSIVDLRGRTILCMNNRFFKTGYHTMNLNLPLAKGTYIISMKNSKFNASRKITQVR